MDKVLFLCFDVNRHTGGLEMAVLRKWQWEIVNRHTGGLEKPVSVVCTTSRVNRHTGGLKNTNIGIIAL